MEFNDTQIEVIRRNLRYMSKCLQENIMQVSLEIVKKEVTAFYLM